VKQTNDLIWNFLSGPKRYIGRKHLSLIATVDKTNKTSITAKGAPQFVNEKHLLFANNSSLRTISNIRDNPQVAVLRLDKDEPVVCLIWGEGEVFESRLLVFESAKCFTQSHIALHSIVRITVTKFEIV
jgi:hypothetical protein